MPLFGTDTTGRPGQYACTSSIQRTLKDLRTKRKGQPVFVVGHVPERRAQEAAFEVFNERLAIIKFSDGVTLGYDPTELLLPTEIDEKGIPYFEIRQCQDCQQFFPLTVEECERDQEPTSCPACAA